MAVTAILMWLMPCPLFFPHSTNIPGFALTSSRPLGLLLSALLIGVSSTRLQATIWQEIRRPKHERSPWPSNWKPRFPWPAVDVREAADNGPLLRDHARNERALLNTFASAEGHLGPHGQDQGY